MTVFSTVSRSSHTNRDVPPHGPVRQQRRYCCASPGMILGCAVGACAILVARRYGHPRLPAARLSGISRPGGTPVSWVGLARHRHRSYFAIYPMMAGVDMPKLLFNVNLPFSDISLLVQVRRCDSMAQPAGADGLRGRGRGIGTPGVPIREVMKSAYGRSRSAKPARPAGRRSGHHPARKYPLVMMTDSATRLGNF